MLRFLQRLLGWDSHPARSQPEGTERRRTPRTSPASVLADASSQATEKPRAAEANQSAEAATPELSLQDPELNRENPELNLENPSKDGSDPYDAGTFNRSSPWSNAGGRKNN